MPHKHRPTRMLPPSQRPRQTGADDPTFQANGERMVYLLERFGEAIHSYYELAIGRGIPSPLTVIVTPASYHNNLGPLAEALAEGKTSGATVHMTRADFEAVLSRTHQDMTADVRQELDKAYNLADGPPVVALLAEHVFVATCIRRTEAN